MCSKCTPVNTETQYQSSNLFQTTMMGRKGRRGHPKRNTAQEKSERKNKRSEWSGKRNALIYFLSFCALVSVEESDPEEHLSARGAFRASPCPTVIALCRLSVSSSAVSSSRRMHRRSTTYPSISALGVVQLLCRAPPLPHSTPHLHCHMCLNQRQPKCAQWGRFHAGVRAWPPSTNTFAWILHLFFYLKFPYIL